MLDPRDVKSKEFTSLPIFRKEIQGQVLLISFEEATGQIVGALLESQGYEVTLASDVEEVFSLVQAMHFSFILFDWFLEGASGIDLCRAIRQVNKKTQVFFYTRKGIGDGIQQAIAASAKEYRIQSVTTNPMLETIFLHLEKNRSGVVANRAIVQSKT
jgi:DNA-binding response OmpR family regulator